LVDAGAYNPWGALQQMRSCGHLRRTKTRVAILGLTIAIGLMTACGGDDNGGQSGAPPSPSASYALLPIESISAIGDYIGTVGLAGQTFDLTDPAGCEAIQEEERAAANDEERAQIIEGTKGRLCINRSASLIDGDRAVVTLQEYTSGAGWLLSMERTDGVWTVTNVQALGLE
jgi:hypothetical protein